MPGQAITAKPLQGGVFCTHRSHIAPLYGRHLCASDLMEIGQQ